MQKHAPKLCENRTLLGLALERNSDNKQTLFFCPRTREFNQWEMKLQNLAVNNDQLQKISYNVRSEIRICPAAWQTLWHALRYKLQFDVFEKLFNSLY